MSGDLTHADLRVIDYLRSLAGDGVARVTHREIAAGAGCTRNTAHSSLARLSAAGLIVVEYGGNGLRIRLTGGDA